MGKKLLFFALVVIVAGLALMLYSDPVFRATSGVAPGARFGNETTFTRSFDGNFSFPGGFGNFTGFRDGEALGSTRTSLIEGISGAGLIGVGALLLTVQLLTTPRQGRRR